MVSDGLLIYKSWWYEPINKDAYNLISKYVKEIRECNDGRMQVKISKFSKKLERIAKNF